MMKRVPGAYVQNPGSKINNLRQSVNVDDGFNADAHSVSCGSSVNFNTSVNFTGYRTGSRTGSIRRKTNVADMMRRSISFS